MSNLYNFTKRLTDLIGAFVALIVFSPVIIASMVAIYMTMGRPIFFTQDRSGMGQIHFRIIKLRTMKLRQSLKESDEERITKLGEVLRKYSLDELPQLINVLLGNMSLVGPRPLLVDYDDKFSEHHKLRFLVRPGITGLAQVNGRNTIGWDTKLEYDVEYVRKQGLALDLKILLKTLSVVVRASGFQRGGEASRFDE